MFEFPPKKKTNCHLGTGLMPQTKFLNSNYFLIMANKTGYQLHLNSALPLMCRVEQEGAEERNMHAVRQNSQVRLGELEGRAVLLNQLPHTLQEEQEDWC